MCYPKESKRKAVNLLGKLTAFNAGDCHRTVTFADVTKTVTV
jgi:hypothetical protein